MVDSLKTPRPIESLKFEVDGEDVHIEVNRTPLALNLSRGFCRIIILDTLRALVRHLKVADPNGSIRIEVEMETGDVPLVDYKTEFSDSR